MESQQEVDHTVENTEDIEMTDEGITHSQQPDTTQPTNSQPTNDPNT